MSFIDLPRFREREAQGLIACREHPTHDLLIWNYTPKCQFEHAWDDVTIQARGLITRADGTVVARPFRKFFNYEEYQGTLPLESFKVTEKMDGSLGILYFIEDTPYIATRGSFSSEQATYGTYILHEKYRDFPFQKYYTYLFEIIYKSNRIVVDYGDMEDLVLLAIIHTETGKEYDIHNPAWTYSWPFPLVRYYDGIADLASLRQIEASNREGFVVCFESGLRLKMKFAEYVRLHRLLTQCSARSIWELLRANQSLDDLLDRVPDEFYAWVKQTRDTLLTQYVGIETFCKEMVKQVQDLPTRKEQAAIVTKHAYSGVVFAMLDNKPYADIIWKGLRPQAERPFKIEEEAA